MAIQIEEGIAPPQRPVSEVRVALEAMKPGQSFAVPASKFLSLQQAAYMVRARLKDDRKFTVRVTEKNEARVWRIQ